MRQIKQEIKAKVVVFDPFSLKILYTRPSEKRLPKQYKVAKSIVFDGWTDRP